MNAEVRSLDAMVRRIFVGLVGLGSPCLGWVVCFLFRIFFWIDLARREESKREMSGGLLRKLHLLTVDALLSSI